MVAKNHGKAEKGGALFEGEIIKKGGEGGKYGNRGPM